MMDAARAKREISLKGHRVMLLPDFSLEKKRPFNPVKKKLKAKLQEYRFIFPANLWVQYNNNKQNTFHIPSTAKRFVIEM